MMRICVLLYRNVYDDIFSRSNNQLYNCLTQFIKYLMNCLRSYLRVVFFFCSRHRHPSSQHGGAMNEWPFDTQVFTCFRFNFSFILFTLVIFLSLSLHSMLRLNFHPERNSVCWLNE